MEEEKGKVIQFPLKLDPKNPVKIDDTALQLHTDLKFADHLTEGLVVNLIHNMGENEVDTSDPNFIRDIGFLIELVKSTIYRDMGIKHPMQGLVDLFVESEHDETQGLYTRFDIDALAEFVGDDKD